MRQRAGSRAKKLADAARHWAARPARQKNTRPRSAEEEQRYADPEAWQEAIDAAGERLDGGGVDGGEEDGGSFAVWTENAETLRVFLALNRCWRIGELNGKYLGLDRPAIESTLRLMQVPRKRQPEIFEDLRVMEHAALEVLNREQ